MAASESAGDDEVLVVFCAVPTREVGEAIAEALVGERLAACVNLLPGVRSVYRWKGEVHRDDEVLAVMKTTAGRFEALRARVCALHPYELPEVLSVPSGPAHLPYLAWVRDETRG